MAKAEQLFSKPVRRVLLATLGVLVVSIVMVAGMPVYLPLSQSNALGLPVIFFPVLWLSLFLWALFDTRLWRVASGLVLLTLFHVVVIASGLGAI